MANSTTPRKRRTLAQRFWPKVQTEGACWLWIGSRSGSQGYGQIRDENGRPDFAHRVSWRLAYGPIPEGRLVLHRCDVPRCVRPQHLYLGSNADNSADMSASFRLRRRMRGKSHPVREIIGKGVLSVRVSEELVAMLDRIGERESMSRSEVIRVSVQELHKRLFREAA